MADIDDFEFVDEINLLEEPTFEVVDVNDVTRRTTNPNTPTTPDVVLPLLIPKPIDNEISPVIQLQQQQQPIFTSPVMEIPPKVEEPPTPIKTTISVTSSIQIKQRITRPPSPPTPSSKTIAPVPRLPPAPPLQRYGNAALIPHNLDTTLDINTIINKSKEDHEKALHALSAHQQQSKDIQTVLEQRRQLLNKK